MKTEGLARPQRDRLEGLGGFAGSLGAGQVPAWGSQLLYPPPLASCMLSTAGRRTPTCPTAWCRPGSWRSSSGEQPWGVPRGPPTAGLWGVHGHPCPWGLHYGKLLVAPVPVRSKAGEQPGRVPVTPVQCGAGWGTGFSHPHPRRHTSKAADVVLLGGDLNMHPEDVGIRLLRGWTGLRDAFAEATRFEVSGRG